jgi:hypothetical protein
MAICTVNAMYGECDEHMYGECGEDMYGKCDEDMYGECDVDMYGKCVMAMYGECDEDMNPTTQLHRGCAHDYAVGRRAALVQRSPR